MIFFFRVTNETSRCVRLISIRILYTTQSANARVLHPASSHGELTGPCPPGSLQNSVSQSKKSRGNSVTGEKQEWATKDAQAMPKGMPKPVTMKPQYPARNHLLRGLKGMLV